MEVYVRPYPGSGARVPVSLHGGTEPVWAHSGRELFFRSGDSLMAAAVSSRPTFAVTGRRLLFTGSFASGDAYREYDVAPDGRHFVMLSGGFGAIHPDRFAARLRSAPAAPVASWELRGKTGTTGRSVASSLRR